MALPRDHQLATREIIYWTDLSDETVLLSVCDPGAHIEDLLVSHLTVDAKRPNIEWHDVSRGIVKSLVSMGLGVGLVMESDVGASLAGLTYREVQSGAGPSRIDFYAHSPWVGLRVSRDRERGFQGIVSRDFRRS
ncbi:hypothetical protein GCM10007858_52700 [Bradyrhizobium liaoningense]|nr:hypothetical protein GCM10007858_52700 [Bradyrhizobium liaoningense]